jgi:hypothetical protein
MWMILKPLCGKISIMDKKTILFYSYTSSTLADLILFSQYLKNDFRILFIVLNEDSLTLLKKHHIEYICLHCKNSKTFYKQPNSNFILNSKIFIHLLKLLKNTSLGQIIKQMLFSNKCNTYITISKEILKNYKIDLLTTFSDGHSFELEIALIKAAKELNIPIFLPFIKNYNFEPHYVLVKDDPQYTLTKFSSLYKKIVLPQYAYQTYNHTYFFPPYMFVVLSKLNVLSVMPWLNGGGASDLVAIPNKLLRQKYISHGIDENKLEILGDLSYLNLYDSFINRDAIKNKMIEQYNLIHQKIIIIGLANWWEHKISDEQTHWKIVNNTIESTLKASHGYSILISLHPSMNIENYLFLEKEYNVKILQEKLMEVLPIADLFVADQSSTVYWSLLCGIKTLVICYYKNMNLFLDFSSIVYANKESEIQEQLEYLISKEISFEHDWDLLSREEVFNSNILQKYITTLKELIKKQ